MSPSSDRHFLSSWLGDTLGMTAELNSEVLSEDNSMTAENHPSVLNYSDVPPSETIIDTARCQVRFQKHKCSQLWIIVLFPLWYILSGLAGVF